MQIDSSYRVTQSGKTGTIALVIGVIGLVLSGAGYAVDKDSFFFSWLVSFFFWLSLGLGGLFFTMLHHMVDAKWSIVPRRIAESMMMVLPWMAIFFIPILFGMKELYPWMRPEVLAEEHLVAGKTAYLNFSFFTIRAVIYFTLWSTLAFLLYRLTRKQDTNYTPELTKSARRISAPGIFIFALSSTFAGFDWLMSLDPAWYSTIFGVYLFAGAFLGTVCFVTLVAMHMRRSGVLVKEITSHHYHDFGKFMFAFVIFWAYMGFSQYFLIWYANIPEETIWYFHRWEGGWKLISLIIMFGHFALPFLFLIPRFAKSNLVWLGSVAVWLLAMRYVDLYWVALPNHLPHGPHFGWIDLGTMMGIGGIFVWLFWKRFTSAPVVPVGDPGLQASINFVNIG